MVNIFGRSYYIDLDTITDKCRIEVPKPKTKGRKTKVEEENFDEDPHAINIFKFELIKMCLERVLTEFTEDDSKMGGLSMDGNSISFKIAFNTLIKNEILIELDDE